MDRTFSNLTIRTVSEDQRIVEGIASTPRLDRSGDSVLPDGAEFSLPIPFLLDHDHTHVVGEVTGAEVTASGIRFRAQIPKILEPGAAKDIVDSAWSVIKNGLRKFVSIGFRPLSAEPLSGGGLKFTRWEWLELSACAVPANADCSITGLKGNPRSRDGILRGVLPKRDSLYDIATNAVIGHRKLSDHEQRIVRKMRELHLKGLDEEIRRLKLGLPPKTTIVRLAAPIGGSRR